MSRTLRWISGVTFIACWMRGRRRFDHAKECRPSTFVRTEGRCVRTSLWNRRSA
jgi:hypothetical protein